jgi:hypothetical protein
MTGHTSHRGKLLSGFAPDIRKALEILEELDEEDRKIVTELAASLKKREENYKKT